MAVQALFGEGRSFEGAENKKRIKGRIIIVFLLLMVCMFFISYMRTNVFDIIGKRKIAVMIRIPEVDENSDIWEWNQALDFFHFNSVIYDKEYLRMVLYANYNYVEKELEYTQIGISCKEGEKYEIHTDAEYVNRYLEKFDITKEDIAEYYRYAIYDVILKTWAERYQRIYGLEKWKLEQCTLIDNGYQFKERKE